MDQLLESQYIHEECVILGSGPLSIAGAVLHDLHRLGRIATTGQEVVIVDTTPTGNTTLDFAVQTLSQLKEKPILLQAAITKLSQSKLTEKTREWLVNTGYMDKVRRKVLGLFPTTDYNTIPKTAKTILKAELIIAAGDSTLRQDNRSQLMNILYTTKSFPKLFKKIETKEVESVIRTEAESSALCYALHLCMRRQSYGEVVNINLALFVIWIAWAGDERRREQMLFWGLLALYIGIIIYSIIDIEIYLRSRFKVEPSEF